MKNFLCLSLFCLNFVYADVENLPARVANLSEDVSLLSQQVKQLRLDTEAYQQENSALKTQIDSLKSQQSVQDKKISELTKLIQSQSADSLKQKQEVIETITKELNKVTAPAPATSTKKSPSVEHKTPPAPPTITTFSSDYPKTGVVYTVEKGDTLSGIAQKMKSTCKDIQNANHIGNPRDLKIGQVIFIPQKDL